MTGQELTPGRRKLYDALFILCGCIGLLCIGLLAFRSNRQERAHFNIALRPATMPINYKSDDLWAASSGIFLVGQPLAWNVDFQNVGGGPALNVRNSGRVFIEPDETKLSEEDAISKYNQWLKTSSFTSSGDTIAKEQIGFKTYEGDILTPEDYQNIVAGRRVILIVGRIAFDDDFGSHVHNVCQRLEPRQPGGALITQDCEEHTEER